MRILVVEDDVRLAEMLTEALTDFQYVVDLAQDGETAWDWVRGQEYDLILLDLTLPKLDGVSFCQRLRQQRVALPILMLTARDTIADKITGLDAGADDYMVKPFDLQELMARIRALLRRGKLTTTSGLSWGSLYLNSGTFEVTYENIPLSLTPKEFAILELLIANGRRVMSRAGIIEQVWSLGELPTEEAVKSHIKSLRNKLKTAGAPEDLIETVHGLGYRLKQF
ncbi:MAG: response regulator transcription factor [Hydrococcus sp. C42_A2020_068]|uniref:response regulator transcription factor n=1 Tax=Pleurocapsa sp. PCC 7327 TaxID=118163 RepID=UPI00029FB5E7|nr:response regulator transcription factor [Pleurocapsa sp. PCC 7327]AFY77088.1 response regulator with CheY-like receiver domain and winged-helix DNA-binding domain [Pleurocapsa sp. PCC 7327]MBF2022492.1 response regulator transcription factor [Hydrococcus sp. C42_A2020_068]